MTSIPTPSTNPPAREWAKDANASISYVEGSQLAPAQTEGDVAEPVRQTLDTSQNVPGSYPVGSEPHGPATEEGSGHGVLQTLQNATETALQGAADAAKRYLPQGIASYIPAAGASKDPDVTPEVPPHISTPKPGTGSKECLSTHHHHLPAPGTKAHKYSLPSTETPTGSSVGVGSLPGNCSEAGVAKLPEERRQESLLSHKTEGEAVGKTDDVGPLPGASTESGVSAPRERTGGQNIAGVAAVAAATTAAAAVGGRAIASTGGHDRSSMGRGGDEIPIRKVRTVPGTMQQVSETNLPLWESTASPCEVKEYPCPGKPVTVPGTQDQIEGDLEAPPPSPTMKVKSGDTRRASTGSIGSKVGFMDRVRGEAKVITGKLGRNERKVEEGRQLLGKV